MDTIELQVYIDRARSKGDVPQGLTYQYNYRLGYEDKQAGKPYESNNGWYIAGYYSERGFLVYITLDELKAI